MRMAATFHDLVAASAAVAATRSRLEKARLLAELLSSVAPDERAIAISFLSGQPQQDTLGLGWAAVGRAEAPPAATARLTLADVDATLAAIAAESGPGSAGRRNDALHELLAAATADEQDFLRRLMLRDLRQGATEGLMVEAIARAAGVAPDDVRRAAMMSGSVAEAGVAALNSGAAGLARFHLALLRPIQPMLAATADDLGTALAGLGEAAVEAKLDGARIQVHRRGDTIAIYTRNLKEVTDRVPEVVEEIAAIPGGDLILDGEVIALRPDGRPHPFQVTMSRFGTRLSVADGVRDVPVTPFFFDILHQDGRDLLDLPASERFVALAQLPPGLLVARIVTADADEAGRFMEATLAAGHEGVMVKALDAPYAAGRRGAAWLKVKPAHTLDLVVLAVEWGSGRRQGWLSNLHLGARDPDGGFVMLGKTFKGMTDEMLAWQTERFLELETHRTGHVVYVRPEQVVEIAFDGVQGSSRYPGGMALRFARVKGYRPDKPPEEADTIDTVRAIYERSR
jgi:DNA ligase-1